MNPPTLRRRGRETLAAAAGIPGLVLAARRLRDASPAAV